MNNDEELTRLQEELTLVLLYLSAWQEKSPGKPVYRSWKGYDFGVLDALGEQDMLYGSAKGNKSVYLTPEGIERAKALVETLLKQRN